MGQIFHHVANAVARPTSDLADNDYLDVSKLGELPPDTSNAMPTLDQMQPVGRTPMQRAISGTSAFLGSMVNSMQKPRQTGGGNNSPIVIPDDAHVDLGAEERKWQDALNAFRGK